MKTDQQKTYCGLEFLESLEKAALDYVEVIQKKKHGKIITDTATTETNKKLNEI